MPPQCRKDGRDGFAGKAILFSRNDRAEQPAAIDRPHVLAGAQRYTIPFCPALKIGTGILALGWTSDGRRRVSYLLHHRDEIHRVVVYSRTERTKLRVSEIGIGTAE